MLILQELGPSLAFDNKNWFPKPKNNNTVFLPNINQKWIWSVKNRIMFVNENGQEVSFMNFIKDSKCNAPQYYNMFFQM